jgi:hypothetical protein
MKAYLPFVAALLLGLSGCDGKQTPSGDAALPDGWERPDAGLADGGEPARLAVYITCHPDDLDIAMAGSMWDLDLNVHPVLILLVTDGGLDNSELGWETSTGSLGRPWYADDGSQTTQWLAPDGTSYLRGNGEANHRYSANLVERRVESLTITHANPPSFTAATAGKSLSRRHVDHYQGSSTLPVHFRQLFYSAGGSTWAFPDGDMGRLRDKYTDTLAGQIVEAIASTVKKYGYDGSSLSITGHLPENAYATGPDGEHTDHRTTGDATIKAIDQLLVQHGFDRVDLAAYAIYFDPAPTSEWTKTTLDLSPAATAFKEIAAQSAWESAFLAGQSGGWLNYQWLSYPATSSGKEVQVKRIFSR